MVRIVSTTRRDDVVARVRELAEPGDPPGADKFAHRYFEPIDDEDLEVRSVDDLARMVLEHWRVGGRREPGEAIVRVYTPPRGHTSVDVITDDMPFLVDSCAMALDRHDLGVHLVVHPIVRVLRTTTGELRGCAAGDDSRDGAHPLLESWTHFEV